MADTDTDTDPPPPPPTTTPTSTTTPTTHQQTDTEIAEQDRLTRAQQEAISEQIAATQPLIASLDSPLILEKEYKNNPEKGFLEGVHDLARRYRYIRKVRGDGNCFYRAFLFAYLSSLLVVGEEEEEKRKKEKEAALAKLTEIIRESKAWLVEVGYDEMAIETFWEVFVEELEGLPQSDLAALEATFNDENGVSSYMVWYCRLLTAGFLKKNKEEYEMFLEGGVTMAEFCAREVEPVGKECEQVQIIALTRAVGVGVRIEYLDGRPLCVNGGNGGGGGGGEKQLPYHVLPEEGVDVSVTLLYRPGHYDVLLA